LYVIGKAKLFANGIGDKFLGQTVKITPPMLFIDKVVPVGAGLPNPDRSDQVEALQDL